MKKSIQLFALMFTLSVCLSCGSKMKESNENDSSTTTGEVSADAKKAEEVAARRARLEAAKTEKAEQRRLAAIEAAKTSPTYKDASGKTIYARSEVSPSYMGGNDAMIKYLHDNLTYPDNARDQGTEGTVFVDFVVQENGKISDVVATDVTGDDLDQSLRDEAVRVVSSMPTWTAGREKGKAVDTKFSLPITFELMN